MRVVVEDMIIASAYSGVSLFNKVKLTSSGTGAVTRRIYLITSGTRFVSLTRVDDEWSHLPQRSFLCRAIIFRTAVSYLGPLFGKNLWPLSGHKVTYFCETSIKERSGAS